MEYYHLYQKAFLENQGFPIEISLSKSNRSGILFESHWHEQLELLFFTTGKAVIECNLEEISVSASDIIIVNSNELHRGMNLNDDLIEYYCIIIDHNLIQSSFIDICELKYINPIMQNIILFKNKIFDDYEITKCIENIIKEFDEKKSGYELAIKSYIFMLLVLLFRGHIKKTISRNLSLTRNRNLERLNRIFLYIEENFAEKIMIDHLASIVNMSSSNLHYIFKHTTGKTIIDYINSVRIKNAEYLLEYTDMNVSEVAAAVGIEDSNYFSKVFKKYKNMSPIEIKRFGKKPLQDNTKNR